MKPSSICFLKNGSASGTKLCHWRTDRETPLRLAVPVLAAGAVVAAGAPGLAASVGLAAGAVVAAGLAASVGLASVFAAGWVAPPQAFRSSRPVVPTVAWRNPRREHHGWASSPPRIVVAATGVAPGTTCLRSS
jgi:hypothetical protein